MNMQLQNEIFGCFFYQEIVHVPSRLPVPGTAVTMVAWYFPAPVYIFPVSHLTERPLSAVDGTVSLIRVQLT